MGFYPSKWNRFWTKKQEKICLDIFQSQQIRYKVACLWKRYCCDDMNFGCGDSTLLAEISKKNFRERTLEKDFGGAKFCFCMFFLIFVMWWFHISRLFSYLKFLTGYSIKKLFLFPAIETTFFPAFWPHLFLVCLIKLSIALSSRFNCLEIVSAIRWQL